MTAPVQLSACAFTHQGAQRRDNEDTIALGSWIRSAPMSAPERFELALADGAPLIALVADGMGGHAAGEVASRVVAERMVEGAAQAVDAAALAGLLRAADAELFAMMRARPSLAGMGTTVAGLVVLPDARLVFNVGDSRVYRLAAAGLEQLSTDDTPGPKLPDGRTAALASHLITQTLGGHHRHDLEPHLLRDPPDRRQRYLLCSDGLSDLLSRSEIERLLEADPVASTGALFEAAMARGGRDNLSVIVLDLRCD